VGWTWRPGIVRNSDEEEIKGAYRRMAKQFHPDGCYLLLLLVVHV
jgi:preprotein translocase subunit Sec63